MGDLGLEEAKAALACHGARCPKALVSSFFYVLLLKPLTASVAALVLCILCQLHFFPAAVEEELSMDPRRAEELSAIPAFKFLLFSMPPPKAVSTECCISTLCPRPVFDVRAEMEQPFRRADQLFSFLQAPPPAPAALVHKA